MFVYSTNEHHMKMFNIKKNIYKHSWLDLNRMMNINIESCVYL